MTNNINVLESAANETTSKKYDVVAGSGKNGHPTHIKAIKEARYLLEEPVAKNAGPKRIIVKWVGKSLHFMLEGSTEADSINE